MDKDTRFYILISVVTVVCVGAAVVFSDKKAKNPNLTEEGTVRVAQSPQADPGLQKSPFELDAIAGGSSPRDLRAVYAQYPPNDTGTNIVEAWARIPPEEKTKVVKMLDDDIANAKEGLKSEPADKKLRHTLVIAEKLKELAQNDFNYRLTAKGLKERK